MKKKHNWSIVFLTIVLLLLYLPVVVVVAYSFNSSRDTNTWSGFSFTWYSQLFNDDNMISALQTSLILGVLSCVISAVIGSLGAVGMVQSKLKTKGIIESISIIPIMIPEIIFGMAFLAFFTFLNFPFGMLTLTIAHVSFCVPYIYILVRSRLVDIDPSIAEAARDLGAGRARVFLDITLPLIMPAVVSGMLLSFAMSMDDVVFSFFTNGPDTNTLPIAIYSQLKVGVSPEVNALSTLLLGSTFIIIAVSNLFSAKYKKNQLEGENQ